MFIASEWSDTEAGREVQLHWGYIQWWRKARRRTGYLNCKVSAVMRALHYSVVMKRELSKKVKPSIFKTVFVPILTYGHESWVMTKRVRLHLQASEMRFLQKIEGVTLFS